MWDVRNQTPFAADGSCIRDINGSEHWVVALRARLSIEKDGTLTVSEQQPEITFEPTYTDDAGIELIEEGDICPQKPLPDFLVTGSAKTPNAQPQSEMKLLLKYGKSTKTARVIGDRTYGDDAGYTGLTPATDFTSMPLSWTRAFGGARKLGESKGAHPYNPAGTGRAGFLRNMLAVECQRAPNFEPITQRFKVGRSIDPVGFGGLQPFWRPRVDYIGTYNTKWEITRAPLYPLDFDNRFFQIAPEDQILPAQPEPEMRFYLAGFDHAGPLEFAFPDIEVAGNAIIDNTLTQLEFNVVTICINTDHTTVDILWNASTPCNGIDHLVSVSTVWLSRFRGVQYV